MKIWISRFLMLLIVLLTAATLIPLIPADLGWIRTFDFPRLQIAVSLLALTLILLALNPRRHWPWGIIGGVAVAFQVFQLFSYSPFASIQAVEAATCQDGNQFTILSANVLQSNTQYDKLLALVRKEQPDILLVMENDQKWVDALSVLEAEYPFNKLRPLDNKYGMALYSKLPLDRIEVRDLTIPGTPSMRARVELPGGKKLNLFTIHPRPPHPGQDSSQRDAELILLAANVKEAGRPSVIIGDFNDVGWSTSMRLFQKVGGVVDPRIGRGFIATFDATEPVMRWPLDHLFHTSDFGVVRFESGPNIGSDHFPLIVSLCQSESRFGQSNDVPVADEDTNEEAADELRKGAGKDVQDEARRLERSED